MSPAKAYYVPRVPVPRPCACGCGILVSGTARRRYVDTTHRVRGWRNKGREQAYYWQHTWQEGEKETLDALATGEGKTFANADEAVRWLAGG